MKGTLANSRGSPVRPSLTIPCMLLNHWKRYVGPLLDSYEFAYLRNIFS